MSKEKKLYAIAQCGNGKKGTEKVRRALQSNKNESMKKIWSVVPPVLSVGKNDSEPFLV